jgi:hypothetical protein
MNDFLLEFWKEIAILDLTRIENEVLILKFNCKGILLGRNKI